MKTSPCASLVEPSPENMIKRGMMEIPRHARAIILFAHGPGKSCRGPRNRMVAQWLVRMGFAVVLPDLADRGGKTDDHSPSEDPEYVERIAERLTVLIDWLGNNRKTGRLKIGVFGARTGAAAAMIAAARRPDAVCAVISRGGRLDLCGKILEQVMAPTLMIVGGRDCGLIDRNRDVCRKMQRKPMFELVHGANHLFEEPGMIEKVASMSCLWFRRHLGMCG